MKLPPFPSTTAPKPAQPARSSPRWSIDSSIGTCTLCLGCKVHPALNTAPLTLRRQAKSGTIRNSLSWTLGEQDQPPEDSLPRSMSARHPTALVERRIQPLLALGGVPLRLVPAGSQVRHRSLFFLRILPHSQ